MNIGSLPRVSPGDILRAFHINDTSDAVERLDITFGPGFTSAVGPAGVRADVVPGDVVLWAKITGHDAPGADGSAAGSSGPYAWLEQIAQADGTWQDGYLSGTTAQYPAFEANFNAAVATGQVVRLRFEEASRTMSFIYAKCS